MATGVEKYFQNFTKHCTIGLSPEALKALGRIPDHVNQDKPWEHPSRYMGGVDWFLPPGGVWADPAGYFTIMTQGVYNFQVFVHCDDEEEFNSLQSDHPELVAIRDEEKKIKGFYGASYVLKDVTHLHDEIISNAVALMSGYEHVKTLKEEAKAKDKIISDHRKEIDAVKADFEKAKLELQLLKKKDNRPSP